MRCLALLYCSIHAARGDEIVSIVTTAEGFERGATAHNSRPTTCTTAPSTPPVLMTWRPPFRCSRRLLPSSRRCPKL